MATKPENSESFFLLNTLEDHQRSIIDLLSNSKHNVFIFSRELNTLLFNNIDVVNSISAIARRTATSDVRIIVKNPQALVDSNHKLLNISRRLPSKIKIQKLTIDPPDDKAFMIVDDNKLWLQHDEEMLNSENSGFANFDARPEVKQFTQQFKDYWRYSESDIRLRQLSL